MTFDEWWKLWEPYWHLRGSGTGKYNMARRGDIGAYEAGNVFIQLATENVSDMRKRAVGEGEYSR